MSLINGEIDIIRNLSANCVISEDDRETTFEITDTKLYDPVVTHQLNIIQNYCNN